jgi:hypothetical protein
MPFMVSVAISVTRRGGVELRLRERINGLDGRRYVGEEGKGVLSGWVNRRGFGYDDGAQYAPRNLKF